MGQATRTGWMVAQAIVMIVLGFAIFHVRENMGTGLFAFLGSILSMLLLATSLLFIVVSDLICMAGLGTDKLPILRRFLSLSAIAAAAGAVLVLFVIDIRGTCWMLAVYSLLLSIATCNLAIRWRETKTARVVLYALAAIAVVFTWLLVWVALFARDPRTLVSIIGAYSVYMGSQMLLTIYYVRHELLVPPKKEQPV